MSQDNQFHQYGYDHYLKAPRKSRAKSAGIGGRIMEGLQSPLVATGALLVTGIVFATIIILAYPSEDDMSRDIPIVRADLRPVTSVPDERDAAPIPNRENTVLAGLGQPRGVEDLGQVENLLAPPPEQDFVSKEQALEQAMAEHSPYEGNAVEEALAESVTPTLIQEAQKLDEEKAAITAAAPDASNVMRKIEADEVDEMAGVAPAEPIAAPAAEVVVDDKPKMHAAATSPETIDFVRSVLNADSAQDVDTSSKAKPEPAKPALIEKQAKAAADIKPAAGAAAPSVNVTSGSYFVQLASITERTRADKEYAKLQKNHAVLSGVAYRVQEANLAKGTFFRIQAGPMSKESANAVCEAIKAQKPGGCLVTK